MSRETTVLHSGPSHCPRIQKRARQRLQQTQEVVSLRDYPVAALSQGVLEDPQRMDGTSLLVLLTSTGNARGIPKMTS